MECDNRERYALINRSLEYKVQKLTLSLTSKHANDALIIYPIFLTPAGGKDFAAHRAIYTSFKEDEDAKDDDDAENGDNNRWEKTPMRFTKAECHWNEPERKNENL
uniref:Uncharacterized protein n=1 Tax=Romanomermis culicivorax TaxID=13658 RepID=A0A915L1Y0_ROMCU